MNNRSVGVTAQRRATLMACVTASLVTQTVWAQRPARPAGASAEADWTRVEQALGRTGTMNPGGVMKFSFPRSDLRVTVAGVQVRPALALGSWVAFKRVTRGQTMVMGDLVLTEDEVGLVMRRLQEQASSRRRCTAMC